MNTPPPSFRTRYADESQYQHKVCSLSTCPNQGLVGCMHCTCNGSCKLGHKQGQCGDFREGSGSQCKKPDCPHDHTCTHSRRAICYTCRRFRVSSSKTQKRQRQTHQICNSILKEIKKSRVFSARRLPGIQYLGSIHYQEESQSLKVLWTKRVLFYPS